MIGGEDGLVYVSAQVVTTCKSTCPLENDREVGVGGSDVDDLMDTVHRTRLERNVLDTGLCGTLNDLNGLPLSLEFQQQHRILQRGGPHDAFLAKEGAGR